MKNIRTMWAALRQKWAAHRNVVKGNPVMETDVARLQRAVETENWNYKKFRSQWEDAQKAVDKYRDGALEVLTRYGLTNEFYWKEVFWRDDGDGITRVKITIEHLIEALLTSRKKVKELERQLRLYRAETPAERRKEVDAAIRESRQYDWHAPADKDVVAAMSKHIKSLQQQLRNQQEVAEYRNQQLAALHVVWCNGGCQGGVSHPEQINEDLVKEAERNVGRLRTWWENRKFRERVQ